MRLVRRLYMDRLLRRIGIASPYGKHIGLSHALRRGLICFFPIDQICGHGMFRCSICEDGGRHGILHLG